MESDKKTKTTAASKTASATTFTWNQELIDRAKADHYYVKASPEKSKQLLITGALMRWKKDVNFGDVYSPEYRLVGEEKNIREILVQNGFNDKIVVSNLKNCYSKTNINAAFKDRFEKETKDYKDYKKTHKKPSDDSTATLNELTELVSHLPSGSANITNKKKMNIQRDIAIKEKYNDLKEDEQLMDVSTMRNDGTGIKNRTTKTIPKNKFGDIETIPIISSDIKNYEIALKALSNHLDEAMIEECLAKFKAQHETVKPKSKSTARSTRSKRTAKEKVAVEPVPVPKQHRATKVTEKPKKKQAPAPKPIVKPKLTTKKVAAPKITLPAATTTVTTPAPVPVLAPVQVTPVVKVEPVVERAPVPVLGPISSANSIAAKVKIAATNRGKVSRRSPQKTV